MRSMLKLGKSCGIAATRSLPSTTSAEFRSRMAASTFQPSRATSTASGLRGNNDRANLKEGSQSYAEVQNEENSGRGIRRYDAGWHGPSAIRTGRRSRLRNDGH